MDGRVEGFGRVFWGGEGERGLGGLGEGRGGGGGGGGGVTEGGGTEGRVGRGVMVMGER